MTSPAFVSIDQNSQPLWDTIPKLEALARRGWCGTHCVEDIDVAFTLRGAGAGSTRLELKRERCYRGGASDWGAALFYTDFLGRNPLDVKKLEPFTGWTTAALCRRVGLTVDELYDRFSGSDNWQLVGASYVEGTAAHRTIGDLSVCEVRDALWALFEHAERDLVTVFPEAPAQARIAAWFRDERHRLMHLLATFASGSLVELYRAWVREHVPGGVDVGLTSELLSRLTDPACPALQLLRPFLSDYPSAAGLYNAAVAESGLGLSPLRVSQGELPFFLVWRRNERLVRTEVYRRDGELDGGLDRWPIGDGDLLRLTSCWRQAGVVCLAGKALLLVLQARLAPAGAPLALPYRGSAYMPAAHRFERKLREAGLLQVPVHPVRRVRFDFVEHWRGYSTVLRLPSHLAGVFPAAEMTAAAVAEEMPLVVRRARERLARLNDGRERERLLDAEFPRARQRWSELDLRRRDLAQDPGRRAEAGRLWDEMKATEREILLELVASVVRDLHVRDLDYWNSRGALLPWSLGVGGPELYAKLTAGARVYDDDGSVEDGAA